MARPWWVSWRGSNIDMGVSHKSDTCVTHYRKNHKHEEMVPIDGLKVVDTDDGTHQQQLKELYRLINRLDRFEKDAYEIEITKDNAIRIIQEWINKQNINE